MKKQRRIQKSVYLGKDETGKKVYKYVYGDTEKEAIQKANEIRAQLGRGVDLRADDTLDFWCKAFVKSKLVEAGEAQANLYKARLAYFTCYDTLNDSFDFSKNYGNVSLKSIKLWQLQAVINALAQYNPYSHKPTAKRTLAAIRRSIVDVYDFAIRNRVTDFNTADGIVIPRTAPKEERRALTAEEQQRIRQFKHKAQLPAMLMMLAGLRRGEVTALTWADVDFNAKTITINKAYDFKQYRIKAPKTAAGVRVVPMPDELCDLLAAQPKTSMLVVHGKDGQRMTNGNWTRLIKTYLNDMNRKYGLFTDEKTKPFVIQPFSWHCLRHTYATILYDAGVDVLGAQKLLGHSDVKTTLGIYTHLSAEREKINIDKLNKHLSAGNMRGKAAENR